MFLSFFGFSQNKNLDYKYAFKIYNLSTYQNTTNTFSDSVSTTNIFNSTFKILSPTIACSWKAKKSNFHEVELTSFQLNKANHETSVIPLNSTSNFPISGNEVTSTNISLRYEYILNILNKSTKPFVPTLGFSVNPYYQHLKSKPHTSQAFPWSSADFGFHGYIIPRVTYYLKSKCFFDFNIPVAIFNFKNSFATVRNPQIPVESQRISEMDFSFLPKILSFRLGVGIKL